MDCSVFFLLLWVHGNRDYGKKQLYRNVLRKEVVNLGKKYSEGENYKVIAFCVSCFATDEQQRLMKKVVAEAQRQNCKVVFFSTLTDNNYGDVNDVGETKIFDAISVECYDAIVLMAESFRRDEEQIALTKRANEAGTPIIVVNKYMEDCINIAFDYKGVFRKIVKHMIEDHGYRTINFMAGVPGISYAEERLDVYKEVLEENGIPFEPERVFYGYFIEEPTQYAMKRMLESELSMPQAIICANDNMAMVVCRCLQEKGYRVPEDIAVSGFDGVDFAKYNEPALTTGGSNLDECVRNIFQIVNDAEPNEWKKKKIVISNEMQMGHSCGCPMGREVHAISEMLQLRAILRKETQYQWEMSQMVANYGNAENFLDVINAIPDYMASLQYRDFWFCANENLMKGTELVSEPCCHGYVGKNKCYTRMMNVLHYRYGEENPVISYQEQLVFGELIPGRKQELEEHGYLLVLPVHMKGKSVGYAVVSFDLDSFWATAYTSFITNFRYLLEMQKTQLKLMRMYMCDSLTGLYNRSGFYQKIDILMEKAKDMDMSVISLDMDRLKMINDTYGHAEGDFALISLARIMQASTKGEIAARLGGDEFIIAFAGEDIEERTEEIVGLIKRGIRSFNENSGKEYELHASIGAYTNRVRNHTLDHFLKKADDLMYARKYLHRKAKGDI